MCACPQTPRILHPHTTQRHAHTCTNPPASHTHTCAQTHRHFSITGVGVPVQSRQVDALCRPTEVQAHACTHGCVNSGTSVPRITEVHECHSSNHAPTRAQTHSRLHSCSHSLSHTRPQFPAYVLLRGTVCRATRAHLCQTQGPRHGHPFLQTHRPALFPHCLQRGTLGGPLSSDTRTRAQTRRDRNTRI